MSSDEIKQLLDKVEHLVKMMEHFKEFYDMDPRNFPHSRNQGWYLETFPPLTVIAARSKKTWVSPTNYHGWIVAGQIAVSNVNMGLIIEVENMQGQTFRTEGTVQEFINAGWTSPLAGGFFVSQPTPSGANPYVALFSPTYPGLPFQKLAAWVKNDDTSSSGTVVVAQLTILRHFNTKVV